MEMVLKRQQQLRKNGKKGFTLVELIVVIVILGILAAIAVPALVGYIDKARTDGAITEAATARTALQTIMSDAYGHPVSGSTTQYTYQGPNASGANQTFTLTITGGAAGPDADLNSAVVGLTSADYTGLTGVTVDSKFQVTGFKITVPGAGKTVTYANGAYTVA